REHAPQPHLLAVRRGPDHRGALRWARGARRPVSQLQDGGPGRAGPRGDRVAHLYTHLVFRVRLHDDGRDRAHHRARQGARAGPVGRMFLRKLRLRLRRQGRNLRPGGGSAARPSAPPFWLFLLLLHDVPTMVRMGLRITTMVASFVWLVAALSPDRLVEAMVARRWSLAMAYLFAATLSAVPILRARARRIVEAQR